MPELVVSGSIIEEQIALETRAVKDGVARYRRLAMQAVERGEGASLKPAESLILFWMAAMVRAIDAEKARINEGQGGRGRAVYGPTLMMLPTERTAFLTLRDVLSRCMENPSGVKYAAAAYGVGRGYFAELNYDDIKKDWDCKKGLTDRVRRLTPEKINWWAKRELDDPHWERNVVVKLGAWLVHNAATVCAADRYDEDDEFVPAFEVVNRWVKKNKLTKFISLSLQAQQLIEDGHALRQFLRPRYLPMVVQPMPWTDDTEGGYVRIRTPYITKPTPEQKAYIRSAPRAKINASLNALNAPPWRINRRLHAIAVELWESGGGIAGMPSREDLPYPPHLPKDADRAMKDQRRKEARVIHRRNHAIQSHRRQVEGQLHVAEVFAERGNVWFPHQFDFRYRAMPIPQPMNHHGNDLCRGLLEYGEGRACDTEAMRWLKIQMASLCGMDKVSFEDRVLWCDDNMEAIEGWAEAPLDNTGWMLQEDAWQALATAAALIDPESAAHLPFRTDGSCNALQHYAAIGRDMESAGKVNLLPADAPNDVYLDVLARVRERVERDAVSSDKVYKARDRQISLSQLADTLLPVLDRKVVKQTAMTTMYDVTDVGAKRQVRGQLKRVGLKDDALYMGGKYLAKLVVECAIESVGAAGPIMAWLRNSASKIAKRGKGQLRVAVLDDDGEPVLDDNRKPVTELKWFGDLVRWMTPLEMPVVQPYRSWESARIYTSGSNILAPDRSDSAKPSVGRQRRGCPPNFVHSIDSTHMLMSAKAAHDEGIHFAAVHDSFWCHAVDAGRTGRVLREQFIELHSLPLLEALYMEWSERHPKAKIDAPPEPVGDMDLNEVLKASYAFA